MKCLAARYQQLDVLYALIDEAQHLPRCSGAVGGLYLAQDAYRRDQRFSAALQARTHQMRRHLAGDDISAGDCQREHQNDRHDADEHPGEVQPVS